MGGGKREKYEKRICKGLKVAIYIRCKNEKSYGEHIDKVVKYCNDMGFEIVAIEKEISAKEPDVRPHLLAAIHNKTAEAVVVSDIERISRNMERVYKYSKERKKNIMADKNETNVCIYCRVGSWEQLTYEKTKPATIAKDCKVKSSEKANA